MPWTAGLTILNPVADQVLADTGALTAGLYRISVIVWSDTGLEVIFQQRDSANAITQKSQIIPVTMPLPPLPWPSIPVKGSERFRVLARAAVTTGSVQISILTDLLDNYVLRA